MKKTYKCKSCGCEVVSLMKPSECQVCGGREWMMLTTTKTVNLGDEPMAIDKDLLSSFKFRSTIQNFCQTVGWNLYSIDDTIAILRFNMDSGSTQTVFIIKYDSTLEFSCPSSLKLDDIDDIPHRLSTLLLKKNAGYKFGFWSIKEIANKQIFSIIHNAEMSLIDINYFCKIVDRLIQECDEFEQAIANIMNS
ncbi:hypothetical protein VB638_00345 [Dolichospermum sp. UHCC 0684]|jgi:hypothetical protein|uniref:hypothetical protein n=2 Tax=Cyanophyceae TaxID=3028117 RepID=UPI00029B77CB|nr:MULTISPECIES: hypothetical protein [Nostocales]AFW96178.1 hypothetical protein ANA_C13516 [Anabaena sp. 90]MEA5528055.1 hypothetical protein [Dolichospermum sp. UHCC 0684]